MAKLLVSVRSLPEAAAALAGGAALIDVKEPSRGALGRADDATVAAVIRFIAGRCPVSAALGEWVESSSPWVASGLSYAKWGLAGCGRRPTWRQGLAEAGKHLRQSGGSCRLVAVAYADWRRADAPPPEEVSAFACDRGWGALLLDTWGKDGSTLLDWASPAEVCRFCRRCREAGVPVALAGSLGPAQFPVLLAAEPDWFAVRGAACHDGCRSGDIDPVRVAYLADLVASVQGASSWVPWGRAAAQVSNHEPLTGGKICR